MNHALAFQLMALAVFLACVGLALLIVLQPVWEWWKGRKR